jgi:hypothetical protein
MRLLLCSSLLLSSLTSFSSTHTEGRKEKGEQGRKGGVLFPLFIFVTMVLNPGPCAFKTNTLPWSYVSSPVLWF